MDQSKSKNTFQIHKDHTCKLGWCIANTSQRSGEMICYFLLRFYLFIFREREREGERERENHRGPGPQPRHVPWLGIEPKTLCFTGLCPVHWATPARAVIFNYVYFMEIYYLIKMFCSLFIILFLVKYL